MITCAEFWVLNEKSPLVMTRGERASYVCHGMNCPDCAVVIHSRGDEEWAKLSPEQKDACNQVLDELRQVVRNDFKDPEYKNVVGKEK
jgi:hypothetical protein